MESVLAKASEYSELVHKLNKCLPVHIWPCVEQVLRNRDMHLFLTDSECNENAQSESIEKRKQASLKELAQVVYNHVGVLSLRDVSTRFEDMDEIYSYMDMLEKGLVKLARAISDPRDVHECRQRCREEHRDANQWLVNIANILLGSAISGTLWLVSGNLAFSPLVVIIVIMCFAISFGLLYNHKKAEREVEERRKICLESCDQQDIYGQEVRRFQEYLNRLREKAMSIMSIQRSCVTRSSSSAMAE